MYIMWVVNVETKQQGNWFKSQIIITMSWHRTAEVSDPVTSSATDLTTLQKSQIQSQALQQTPPHCRSFRVKYVCKFSTAEGSNPVTFSSVTDPTKQQKSWSSATAYESHHIGLTSALLSKGTLKTQYCIIYVCVCVCVYVCVRVQYQGKYLSDI